MNNFYELAHPAIHSTMTLIVLDPSKPNLPGDKPAFIGWFLYDNGILWELGPKDVTRVSGLPPVCMYWKTLKSQNQTFNIQPTCNGSMQNNP